MAVAETALDAAQTAYEKAKVDIDRATGDTLDRMDVSIDDAKIRRRNPQLITTVRS